MQFDDMTFRAVSRNLGNPTDTQIARMVADAEKEADIPEENSGNKEDTESNPASKN